MSPDPANPYVGVRPYEPGDRSRFFGRASELEQIRDLWLSNRLLVVYGDSGAGKTSLLNAGALPVLTEPGAKYRADVLPLGRVPQPSAELSPDQGDSDRPNPYVFTLLSSWAPTRTPDELAEYSLSSFLQLQLSNIDEDGYPYPLLAAIDQFEQVFTGGSHRLGDQENFLFQLAEATARVKRLRLLISIRAEYFTRLLPYEAAIGLDSRARFHVTPLSPDAALEAVVRPLRTTPRRYAPGVAERLVEDLRTITTVSSIGETSSTRGDSVEPLHLQVTCSGLWDALPAELSVITAEQLRRGGSVDEYLLDYCTSNIQDAAEECARSAAELWTWLNTRFITDRGTRGTVYEGISETGELPNKVAWALESRRILKSEQRLGSRWFELQHDRLVTAIRDGARLRSLPGAPRFDSSGAGYLRQAQAALTEGRLTLAEHYALEAARIGNDSSTPNSRAEAESFLARNAALRGQIQDAVDRYRAAIAVYLQLQDNTAVGRVRAEVGQLFYASGDLNAALDELSQAVRLLPGDLSVKVELARVLRDVGQLQAAIAMLNAAINVAPDLIGAVIERGLIQLRLGDFRSARADLRNAIRLDAAVGDRAEIQDALRLIERNEST